MLYASPMKIGELSGKTGVSIDTIRYYEKRGLIPQASRSPSGYRHYANNDAIRLRFIVQAKELGFTLKEISQLLGIRASQNDCQKIKSIAEAKAEEIAARIQKLSRMRDTLLDMAAQCEQSKASDPCPILKSLGKST